MAASFRSALARTGHRIAQARAHHAARNASTHLPPAFAEHVNNAIAPHFHALAPGDKSHLVAVATRLARQGAADDLITAGLLHDIGKAIPGLRVGLVDRAACVLLRRTCPGGIRWLAARATPPLLGAGLWVVARHPTSGAAMLARAGYGERVQWLVANHERIDLDDRDLRALVAADNAGPGPATG